MSSPSPAPLPPTQADRVAAAFSQQSAVFDAIEAPNAILHWMRGRVRRHVLGLLPPGSHLLELNAGTGLDAAFFAGHGHRVHATDAAPGMVAQLRARIETENLHGRVTVEQRAYTDLAGLPAGAYDGIFSNFGGLNCIPDVAPVVAEFARLLRPGGVVVLVVMPRVSLWEIGALLKGHFRLAFRRFRPGGVLAQVEEGGPTFRTWYFSPAHLSGAFGPSFQVSRQGLGALVPPPHLIGFPRRFPRLFGLLCRWETQVAAWPPFRSWADHLVLSARYRG